MRKVTLPSDTSGLTIPSDYKVNRLSRAETPPGVKARRPHLLFWLTLLSCVLSIVVSCVISGASRREVIGIGTSANVLFLIYALRSEGFDWQSGPVAYLSVLFLFHFPSTLFQSLKMSSVVPDTLLSWIDDDNWYRAAAYANACAASFAFGCLAARRRCGGTFKKTIRPNHALYSLGLTTAILAALYIAALFLRVGGEVFEASYLSLFDTLFGSAFTLASFLVTVGTVIALVHATRVGRIIPIVVQASIATVILLTGARQYALVGVVIVVVMLARANLRLKPVLLLGGVFLALIVISAVGASRDKGVLSSARNAENVGPESALAEMGGSLKAVSLGIEWIGAGDELRWGGGYWLPFERGLGLVVPGIRDDLSLDPRNMGALMSLRNPGLGGSAVAESYYNFGQAGVAFFVMAGFLLSFLHLKARSGLGVSMEAVVLYSLILQIRNWFISVPALIVIGALPVLIGLYLKGGNIRLRGRIQQVADHAKV